MINKHVKNFWDKKHIDSDIDSLSGVGYDETIDFLKIRNFIENSSNVMEIGVGLGYVTEGLYKMGINVTAVDISDIALNNVKNYCDNVYNIKDLDKLQSDYFDVIICNNVIQHVPTDTLIVEMGEFIRSLKNDGVFAIEFVSSNMFEDNGIDPHTEDCEAGRLCRSPKYMEKLINGLGGYCEIVHHRPLNVSYLTDCYVFHIRKK